jgi:hypothetical protein
MVSLTDGTAPAANRPPYPTKAAQFTNPFLIEVTPNLQPAAVSSNQLSAAGGSNQLASLTGPNQLAVDTRVKGLHRPPLQVVKGAGPTQRPLEATTGTGLSQLAQGTGSKQQLLKNAVTEQPPLSTVDLVLLEKLKVKQTLRTLEDKTLIAIPLYLTYIVSNLYVSTQRPSTSST